MKNWHLVILNIVLLLIVLFVTQYNSLTNYYKVNDDVRKIFFVNNFNDYLKDNLLAQYVFAKWDGTSPYLTFFYVVINNIIDFILVTKIMSIITFLTSVIFAYKLGKAAIDERYALILAFLFILQPWNIQPFSGGMSKAFAFPLLIAFLYYMIKKDILKLAMVLVLEAALYPPAFLISFAMFGLSLIDLKEKKINIDVKKNCLFYIFAIVSFILILAPLSLISYSIDKPITFKEAIYYPEFYENGRVSIFRGQIPFISDPSSVVQTLINIYNPRLYSPFYNDSLFILFFLSLIFMISYRKGIFRLPKGVYLLLISSLILQSVAALVLFKLYLPVRYVQYSIPLFLIIFLAHGLYLMSINKKTEHFFALLLLILIVFYIPKIDARLVHCEDEKLYSYIQELPKDSLISGYPVDMNCVALYGKRRPFIMSELNLPLFADYYTIIKERNIDFFSAYYSENEEEINKFCKENNVTNFIIDTRHFSESFLGRRKIFDEPFNTHIKNITKNRKDFYLKSPDNVLFESGNKMVIGCGT